MLKKVISAILLFCSLAILQDAKGQELRFRYSRVPMSVALGEFMTRTGADVVYAPDLIEGRVVTCTYTGGSPYEAIRCIVRGTGLVAERVNQRQFVLVPIDQDAVTTARTRRGIISGYVLDAESGESLRGAHVYLPGIRAGTVTNEAGYFALPGVPSGRQDIRVSFIGFLARDTTVTVGNPPVVVDLIPITVSAGDIVVQSAVQRADLTVVPGLVSIPVRRLEELPGSFGGKDIFEVLRLLPGIQRTGEATGGLLVRGSSPDQNLYLIDGAPIYHPWHAFSLISTFQTETFKDVKFYRGAFPAEYGGRLSAVLDAELRDGMRATPRMLASINSLNARFLIESPISPESSFMLSGRRSYIDKIIGRNHPVEDDMGKRDTLRTGYYFYDWSAKISLSPTTDSRLSFSYYTGKDVLDLRLPFDLSLDFSSWLRPADLFFEVDQAWGNTLYSLRYQWLVSDRFFVTGTAYSTEYAAREAAFIHPTKSSSVKSSYTVRLNDLGLKIDADFFASLHHQLRGGFAMIDHRFQSDIDALVTYGPGLNESLKQDSEIRAFEYAAYIQDHWRPTPDLQILAGTRLSYSGSGSYLRLSPRFSFQYSVDPTRLVFRGSATTQVQYLQRIRDRFSFLYDLVSSRWIPSSEDVVPSRSRQVSLGAESHPWPWVQITVEGYVRKGRNVLLPRDEFQSKNGLLGPGIEISTLLGQYTLGEDRSVGIELGSELSFAPWKILLAYTGSRSQNRTPEMEDTSYQVSRFDVPRSFSLVAQRIVRAWDASLSVIWRAGYPVTVPVARYALSDPVTGEDTYYFNRPRINNGRLPPYFRIDAGIGYHFRLLDVSWTARLHLYNVLNRRNVMSRTFDPAIEDFAPRNRLGLPFLPLFDIEIQL